MECEPVVLNGIGLFCSPEDTWQCLETFWFVTLFGGGWGGGLLLASSACPKSAGTLRSESEVRGTLKFLPQLEMRPSSNAPNPVECREAPPTSSFPDFSEPP